MQVSSTGLTYSAPVPSLGVINATREYCLKGHRTSECVIRFALFFFSPSRSAPSWKRAGMGLVGPLSLTARPFVERKVLGIHEGRWRIWPTSLLSIQSARRASYPRGKCVSTHACLDSDIASLSVCLPVCPSLRHELTPPHARLHPFVPIPLLAGCGAV